MVPKPTPFAVDDRLEPTEPLTAEERATIRRAEADIAAGCVQDHAHVAKWLRRRAREIIESAGKRPKLR